MSLSVLESLLGFLLGLLGASGLWLVLYFRARRQAEERDSERTAEIHKLRADVRVGEAGKRGARELEEVHRDLTLFFHVYFPDLIRRLNSNRDKRNIAPLLLQMLDYLFAPNQISVFYQTRKGDCLRLVASQGVGGTNDESAIEIKGAKGPIGWVAHNKSVMATRDASFARSFDSVDMGSDSRFQADLCAALVDPERDRTLGVIAIGGPRKNQREGKKMIKMVADLGSLAMKHTENYQRIQALANQDGLTGLFNKRFGSDQLALAANRTEQLSQELSILLFDIDYFKIYNDSNGHLAGDEVLRQIGHLVLEFLRADDFAVRFGGEEFLVVFQGIDKQGALLAAERLRSLIENQPFPFEAAQPGGKLTISGGVASLRKDAGNSTELIRLADEALYDAKKSGRNRVLPYRAVYVTGEKEPAPSPPASHT